jgi:CheY-like chemotaxis protein
MKRRHLILLVDDSDDDAFFLDRAVSKAGLGLTMRRVRNGQEAIDYLEGIDQFSDRKEFPLPDVIMLDLKMPVCDGFDFLKWKRNKPSLVYLPTIVMTSSDLPRDIRRSYELGAHSFTTKLKTPDSLSGRIEALREWWFQNCVLVSPFPGRDGESASDEASDGQAEDAASDFR